MYLSGGVRGGQENISLTPAHVKAEGVVLAGDEVDCSGGHCCWAECFSIGSSARVQPPRLQLPIGDVGKRGVGLEASRADRLLLFPEVLTSLVVGCDLSSAVCRMVCWVERRHLKC